MNHYTVAPNKDVTTWIIKIEDIASADEYDKYDDAIKAAEDMARQHQPSTLNILNEYHENVETRTFTDE